MNWQASRLSAEIMRWRDDQALEAVQLISDVATIGSAALEAHLADSDWLTLIRAPEKGVRDIMRPPMRAHIIPVLDRLFVTGARDLRRIDERLETLALAYGVDRRPHVPANQAKEAPEPNGGGASPRFGFLASSFAALTSRIPAAARQAAEHILQPSSALVKSASTQLEGQVRDLTGLSGRLRSAGQEELRRYWQGMVASEDRPLLSQILAIIDATAVTAREQIA